jgi:hypothetical protein
MLGACIGVGRASLPTDAATDGSTGPSVSADVSRGINVDPANLRSRPCSDLGPDGLHVGGFVRMPIKFQSADWTWSNGGFDGYLRCLRTTLPGITIIGTLSDASVDPMYQLPANPYYSHHCDPDDLAVANCPEFDSWLAAYSDRIDPTILARFDVIEVFNEPDDTWDGHLFKGVTSGSGTHSSIPPIAYARLLDACYAKFRDSVGKPIMMGGMDSGQASYLTAMGAYRSDFVNIHPYGKYPANTPDYQYTPATHSCSSSYGTVNPCFGSIEQTIDDFAAADRAAGGSGAMIITEWGTSSSQSQGNLIRAFFHDPVIGGTNAMMFAYSDANQSGYGVVDIDDRPKPSYAAFASP